MEQPEALMDDLATIAHLVGIAETARKNNRAMRSANAVLDDSASADLGTPLTL